MFIDLGPCTKCRANWWLEDWYVRVRSKGTLRRVYCWACGWDLHLTRPNRRGQ